MKIDYPTGERGHRATSFASFVLGWPMVVVVLCSRFCFCVFELRRLMYFLLCAGMGKKKVSVASKVQLRQALVLRAS